MAYKIILVLQNALNLDLVCFLRMKICMRFGKYCKGQVQFVKFPAAFMIITY